MIRRNIARMLRPRVNWVEKLVIDDFAAESDPALGPIKFNDHNLFKIASQIVPPSFFGGRAHLRAENGLFIKRLELQHL